MICKLNFYFSAVQYSEFLFIVIILRLSIIGGVMSLSAAWKLKTAPLVIDCTSLDLSQLPKPA